MADLHFQTIDESTVRIHTDRGILQEIAECFTFYVPGYKFTPKYKAGIWDGKIRPISVMKFTAPKGLVPAIVDKAKELGYSVSFADDFKRFLEKVEYNKEKLDLPFPPYDYQENAIEICLKKKRAIILSSTGSGKSYIIYNLVRTLEDKKILVITPRIGLVTQLYSDFIDYSKENGWNTEKNCHKIHSGADKHTNKRVVITTWQSVFRMPKEYFAQFDVVMGDEVHEFEAKSCSGILDKCSNAFYRFGFTGTLEDAKTHEITLTGAFGPIKRVSSTKDLQDRGILAQLKIKAIVLKHDKATSDLVKGSKYQDEVSHIVQCEKRNNFIYQLSAQTKGNTLVLVNLVEKHGKPLYKKMKNIEGKEVHFVYGGTDADVRENIRQLMEKKSNVVVIASMKVFSTGINIKNLMHIVFAHPTKAKIKILQSIGRGLRLHKDKDACILWDIVDDCRGSRKTANYALIHFQERYKIYMKEQFQVQIINRNL